MTWNGTWDFEKFDVIFAIVDNCQPVVAAYSMGMCFVSAVSQAMNMFPCCVMVRHGKLLPDPRSDQKYPRP
jgi:hypothetical protein